MKNRAITLHIIRPFAYVGAFLIRVCVDPNCEGVFHDHSSGHCDDCGERTVKINIDCYLKKFHDHNPQYQMSQMLTGSQIIALQSQMRQSISKIPDQTEMTLA